MVGAILQGSAALASSRKGFLAMWSTAQKITPAALHPFLTFVSMVKSSVINDKHFIFM